MCTLKVTYKLSDTGKFKGAFLTNHGREYSLNEYIIITYFRLSRILPKVHSGLRNSSIKYCRQAFGKFSKIWPHKPEHVFQHTSTSRFILQIRPTSDTKKAIMQMVNAFLGCLRTTGTRSMLYKILHVHIIVAYFQRSTLRNACVSTSWSATEWDLRVKFRCYISRLQCTDSIRDIRCCYQMVGNLLRSNHGRPNYHVFISITADQCISFWMPSTAYHSGPVIKFLGF